MRGDVVYRVYGVHAGLLRREERFGYLELATFDFKNPCLTLDPVPRRRSDPPPFIRLSRWKGAARITFAVEMKFDLDSGKPEDWERQRIADFE